MIFFIIKSNKSAFCLASQFEFYPQRSKLFFEAKRSVNNPSEARKIQDSMMKSQTYWQIDANYKHYIEAGEKQEEVEVSTDEIVNRIRQQKRYRDIERLHN